MKILVVKTSSLGDIIHTLPAVRDAARAVPSLTVDWVVEEAFKEIPKWHLNVHQVIPVAWRRWRKNWREFKSEFGEFKRFLQQEHYDKIIDAQGLIKSGIIALLAKGERIGLSWSSLTEPLARPFYHKAVHVDLSKLAVTRMRSIFAQSLGYSFETLPLHYGLQGLPEPKGLQKPYVFFAHGTTWSSKQWPVQYWLELARKVQNVGHFVCLSWYNDSEKEFANYIASQCSAVIVLPKQKLTTIASIIACAKALVGVDTGLSHLAAAYQVPSITLYGPTNPERTGTVGLNQFHLRAQSDCQRCDRAICRYRRVIHSQPQCLKAIDVTLVFNKLLPLLQ
jgi:heptosyltransferase-1